MWCSKWLNTSVALSGARRRIPGQGAVWEEQDTPCIQARIGRLLIQAGYAGDPRLRRAAGWLLATQRPDGMWLCDRAGRHGWLRATLDLLHAAALDAELAASPAAAGVCDLLLEPHVGRYHMDTRSIPEV